MPKLVSSKVKYLNARDKVVEVWEHFDDQVPDNEKQWYRQLMFQYLLDMFGSWEQSGDSLPSAETLYYLARIREKVS